MNQRGMSIVSVLAALAMTSVVSVAMMEMFRNLSVVQRSAKARDEATTATALLSMYLRDKEFCKKNLLGGAGVAKSLVESGVSLREFKSKNGDEAVAVVGREGITGITLEPIKRNRGLASISTSRYMAQVRLTFESEGILGGGVGDRVIPVVMSLAGPNLTDCSAASEDDTDDPHRSKENCKGTYFPADSVSDPILKKHIQYWSSNPLASRIPVRYFFDNFVSPSAGLKAVTEEERESLLDRSPPSLVLPPSTPSVGSGYAFIDPGQGEPGVEVRQIDGKKYFVTPTVGNGYSMITNDGPTQVERVEGVDESGHYTVHYGPPTNRVSGTCVGGTFLRF